MSTERKKRFLVRLHPYTNSCSYYNAELTHPDLGNASAQEALVIMKAWHCGADHVLGCARAGSVLVEDTAARVALLSLPSPALLCAVLLRSSGCFLSYFHRGGMVNSRPPSFEDKPLFDSVQFIFQRFFVEVRPACTARILSRGKSH